MNKKKIVYVAVSALALSSALNSGAYAQLQITCAQRFYIGEHAACGNANGTLTVDPDGSTSTSGCIATVTPPQAGRCVLWNTGPAPTRNVVVQFTTPSIFIDAGGPQAQVNNFRMEHSGAASPAVQFTFTPTEVTNTVTLYIGGRLNFNGMQSLGTYTSNISITANLI